MGMTGSMMTSMTSMMTGRMTGSQRSLLMAEAAATVGMAEATVGMVEATVGIVEAAMTKSSHPQSLQFPRDGVKKGKSFYPSIHISWIVLHAACFLSDFFLRDF